MKKILVSIALIFFLSNIFAEKNPYEKKTDASQVKHLQIKKMQAEPCAPASSKSWLDINNVRTIIHTGGDMWWDLKNVAQYYIPANSKKTSMFAAALWIAGTDINGQLKVAALRFRSGGSDYWTGPLTTDGTASIDAAECKKWDKHFVMTRNEVNEFLANGKITKAIAEWPAHGDESLMQDYWMAPFKDIDGNDKYEPEKGDYPYYDIEANSCVHDMEHDNLLFGDKTLWWVFNDKGNIHTESKGAAIGLEIRAQAFGFATNDEINNMTFYNYKIINRSTYRLKDTYFSQWVDTDLGYSGDDYVGCDVKRGLGYCYNGKTEDGTGKDEHYGANPPAVGVDFFQGPYMDPDNMDNPIILDDGKEEMSVRSVNGVNFDDGIVDNERFGMRRFVYHNNASGVMGDPDNAIDYYNYLRGIWKDGTKMRYGGNAHPSAGGNGPICDFMFPGDSDPVGWGTSGEAQPFWSEESAGNFPGDRRFMQSAGPFTLEPGAVNFITVGIPWARATSGGPWASVELLRVIDDKCQRLFDNCFKVVNGPDAPELAIQELDKKLILMLSNENPMSNNYRETYVEYDFNIITPDTLTGADRYDSLYRFEGYQIYQLLDASVSISEIGDQTKARLVEQCDVKNDVKRLINYTMDESIGALVPKLMVTGVDEGIKHSFVIEKDAFTNAELVNFKKYYFVAIAYAHNEYLHYSSDGSDPAGLLGQKEPYKAGRKSPTGSIKSIMAVPHKPTAENNGTITNSEYGFGPKIKRIEGQGNGGNNLELTKESIDSVLTYGKVVHPIYKNGNGPVNIKVIDPLNVKASDYEIKFTTNVLDTFNSLVNGKWQLLDKTNNKTYYSQHSIDVNNEQIFPDLGISITINQIPDVGTIANVVDANSFIASSVEFSDSSRSWLGFIPDFDGDGKGPLNWIKSGSFKYAEGTDDDKLNYSDYATQYWETTDPINNLGHYVDQFFDEDQLYEKVVSGGFAPYKLCSWNQNHPGLKSILNPNTANKLVNFRDLASIDLVITADKSKWTRSPVIEMCDDDEKDGSNKLSEGQVTKFSLRAGKSVDKDGNVDGTGTGMGWFPGYAINVETGERLNIAFGEDSWLMSENGRDMKWNPTSNYFSDNYTGQNNREVYFGGKHYIYIFGHKADNTQYITSNSPAYDEGNWVKSKLSTIGLNIKKEVFKEVMWVGNPILNYGFNMLENTVTIRIRVAKPYKINYAVKGADSESALNNNNPYYSFSTNDIATVVNDFNTKINFMENIGVVPNPYNAYSAYETNQVDNRVRIINLPNNCQIKIYTINGNLVRSLSKDDVNTYMDWDLKNQQGIPIASGAYLFHIYSYPGPDKKEKGHKVVKWFATMRPMDLNSY